MTDRPAPAPRNRGQLLRQRTALFLGVNLFFIAAWFATGAGAFWPVWLLLGTGVAYAKAVVPLLLRGDDPTRRR
jgi:hypothetical protein